MRFNGIGSFAAHEGLGPTVEGSKLVYVVTAPNDFCSYAIHYREQRDRIYVRGWRPSGWIREDRDVEAQ